MVSAFRPSILGLNPARSLYLFRSFVFFVKAFFVKPCRNFTQRGKKLELTQAQVYNPIKALSLDLEKYYLESEVSQPFPKREILDSSKLKEFADDNFKYDENDRKFLKWVENTVGKEEIARNEQFLLFPQCFQKTCTANT